jgi:hypothetical protein
MRFEDMLTNRNDPTLRDPNLVRLYERVPGAVAFIDESYRARPRDDGWAFYAMSAVVFDVAAMVSVRLALTSIADGNYWHTTDEFQRGNSEAILKMTSFLVGASVGNVVSVEAPVKTPTNPQQPREACLAALAKELCRGEEPEAVRLLVLDANKEHAMNAADQRCIGRLRSTGVVDANTALYHAYMGSEPLLWAADTVSWSVYRALANDDMRWLYPLRDVITILEPQSGDALKMKQPQGSAERPGAQSPTGPQGGQATAVPISTVPQEGPGGTFIPGNTILNDLVAQITATRQRPNVRRSHPSASDAATETVAEILSHWAAPRPDMSDAHAAAVHLAGISYTLPTRGNLPHPGGSTPYSPTL